ncbi:50S ribosomal protein L4 [Candidatus Palauibacter soopunensis]|uniref:50S ribosomal protein L4 n=1 Tax=Candidatus Palauibacter soopunensis TaxID=3056739 RepID=UPI0023827050|nr:50S ribosomal protein L4 [Candidatus Palauibacter soopunensis]MDE2878248.1 50S ribosomal protein L4 [Candidatus Palauibacter soopunensis]
MKVATYSSDGTAGAERVLPETPFDGVVNEDVLHQVVTAVLANRRQGTASTKTRSTVRGGSRKPWRQKGTGRARAGSIRSALWRGGSVVFGPQPRSYRVRVPRRIRRLAIRSALNTRAMNGDLALIEPLDFDPPKTRRVAALLASIGRGSGNILFLTAGHKPDVHLSARNLPGVRVLPWGEASAYDILWSDLVLVESSVFDAVGDSAGEGDA